MRPMRWLIVVVGFSLSMFAAACSDDDQATCGNSDDCGNDQICSDGVCRAPSSLVCNGDPDCPGGYQCVSGQCELRQEIDAGNSNANANANLNNTSMPDMGGSNNIDPNPDNVNPTVVSFTPADGTADVALDTAITITFDEAMRETSMNKFALPLKDGSNNDVDTAVTYDAASFTATISPVAPLRPATPYTIVGGPDAFDESGNRLIESRATFYTTFEEPAHHTAAAEKYAPHIYQAIRSTDGGSPNGDIPTTVDFDGNQTVADNEENARLTSSNVRARVYYSVIESESHLFIHYTLYYAWRYAQDMRMPHDFTGIVVVVNKENGEVQLVEGVALRRDELFTGFKVSGRGVGDNQNGGGSFDNLPSGDLIDGDRFPLYVTPGTHEACAWTVDGSTSPVSVCLHQENTFTGETGVVIKPGDTAQRFAEAADSDGDNIDDLTYQLVPLVSTLWTRRSAVGIEAYWESNAIYRPDGMRPNGAEGEDAILLLPTSLTAPRDDNNMAVESFGRPPFQWFEEPNSQNAGQWFLDPAYLLTVRYTFPAGYSQDYCFNPFLGIDRLNDPAAPNCAVQ